MPQRPAQPVQPPHHQRVPRPQLLQDLIGLSSVQHSNAPDARSVHTRQQPAAVSSATCRSGFCSTVDTRVQPSRCDTLRTVPQTLNSSRTRDVGFGHQLRYAGRCQSALTARSQEVDQLLPLHRPGNERLRDVLVARVTGLLAGSRTSLSSRTGSFRPRRADPS